MKDGFALCISCGRKPEKREIPKKKLNQEKILLERDIRKKMESLSKELEQESNHEKQQEILKSINSVLEALEKMKNRQ